MITTDKTSSSDLIDKPSHQVNPVASKKVPPQPYAKFTLRFFFSLSYTVVRDTLESFIFVHRRGLDFRHEQSLQVPNASSFREHSQGVNLGPTVDGAARDDHLHHPRPRNPSLPRRLVPQQLHQ